jgi:hypothetical protein
MAELRGTPGFAPRTAGTLSKRRIVAVELIATVTLTVSLVVAATAVSLGNRSLARDDFAGRPSIRMPTEAPLARIGDW